MSTGPVFVVAGPHVVADEVDGEVIVINLDNGAYFSFRESAALVWQILLDAGGSLDVIVDHLSARYDGDRQAIVTAVAAFLKMIQTEGLIAEAAEPARSTSTDRSPVTGRQAFVVPTFEKYTDMEEFLLVDPIHEVDVSEWPAYRKRD